MPHNKEAGITIPTVATIIINYMANKKAPVPLQEITALVRHERSDLLSKDVCATVRSILYRDKRFVRISHGMYYLKQAE